jgi:hypothetical protein
MLPGRSPKGTAAVAGGLFFPQSKSLGIDLGPFSPALLDKIVHAGTVCPSFALASNTLHKLADLVINEKRVERLVRSIGEERVTERDTATAAYQAMPLATKFELPEGIAVPALAVVMVDGGRLQIRDTESAVEPVAEAPVALEEAPSVELALDEEEAPAKNKHWREDRIGLLLTMRSQVAPSDPCPQIPPGFLDAGRVRRLARELTQHGKITGSVPDTSTEESALPAAELELDYEPPPVSSSRVLASRNVWDDFTPMIAGAAWSGGFQKAERKAFVADGAQCNWTLQKRCFAQFEPILDFIHALSYVYGAALAGQTEEAGWEDYQQWIQWVWQGNVVMVIAALHQRQTQLGLPEQSDALLSPRRVVAKTLTYLQNHQEKMHYDAYRREGLPITSSHVESTVKLINRRVKGTEKFWSEEGAEAILQLRADYLSDNEPLDEFWQRRQAAATGLRPYRRAS